MSDQQLLIDKLNKHIIKLNKKLKRWLISFLILLIITTIISFWYMFGGAGYCQDNPFDYGANFIAKELDGNIRCDCTFYGNKEEKNILGIYQKKIVRFSFNNKGYEMDNLRITPSNLNILSWDENETN